MSFCSTCGFMAFARLCIVSFTLHLPWYELSHVGVALGAGAEDLEPLCLLPLQEKRKEREQGKGGTPALSLKQAACIPM